MSACIKVIQSIFALALTICEIFTFQNSWPWKCRSKSWCTTFTLAPCDGKYISSYLMTIVMFVLSLNVYKIFSKQEKCQNWPWKWRSWSRSRGTVLAPFAGYVRIHIGNFFIILATWEHTFKQTLTYTSTHMRTHARAHTHAVMHARIHASKHAHTKAVVSDD